MNLKFEINQILDIYILGIKANNGGCKRDFPILKIGPKQCEPGSLVPDNYHSLSLKILNKKRSSSIKIVKANFPELKNGGCLSTVLVLILHDDLLNKSGQSNF